MDLPITTNKQSIDLPPGKWKYTLNGTPTTPVELWAGPNGEVKIDDQTTLLNGGGPYWLITETPSPNLVGKFEKQ